MSKDERLKKAKEILFRKTPADRILDTYDDYNYIEFTCSAGGDVMRIRIYDNGTVVEK